MLSATNSSGPSNISSRETECNIFELSFPVEVIKILVVSILSLSGLIGNTFIILMVYKRKELRKTTNFFIVNMAVSDLFYPLTGITATLSSTSLVRSSRLVIASTTELISCHLVSFFSGCFVNCFYREPCLHFYRSVCGGCVSVESPSHYSKSSHRCHNFHLVHRGVSKLC